MFQEIVEFIWWASVFTFGWSLAIMVMIGLPAWLIRRYASSEDIQTQADAMGRFVFWWSGLFSYFGLLGMFYSYIIVSLL
jgi:hypothetical protein